MAAASAEVDWESYFQSIQPVCPWSLAAWRKGLIDIQHWNHKVLPLENYLARVYIVDLNSRRLKKLCDRLEANAEQDEWLWSHPRYGGDSTPVPVMIQQNRSYLNKMREKNQ